MFKKPVKKIQQRRVFSAYSDEEPMDMDQVPDPPKISSKDKKKDKKDKDKDKDKSSSKSQPQKSLLSFDHEEEEGEVFKVKKSKHSKMLNKERRNKKKNQNSNSNSSSSAQTKGDSKDSSNFSNNLNSKNLDYSVNNIPDNSTESNNSNLLQKEIRTAGLLLVVKNPDVILNGRAALCAGKDDLSSEEEEEHFEEKKTGNHRFAKPSNLNFNLESGDIPDASLIHEIRKQRQRAREQGEFIAIEDPPEDTKGKRIVHEDEGGDGSDDDEDRVDMLAITGQKEWEERREKFYSVQQELSGDDSDMETNEWENMQIRKGVTGAQLISAQQESVYSQYMSQPFTNSFKNMVMNEQKNLTTAELLEQAYSHVNYELTKRTDKQQKKSKDVRTTGPKTPAEIKKLLIEKLQSSKELNRKHLNDIERITNDIENTKLDKIDCEHNAPRAAEKYKVFQEIKYFVMNLEDCLNEKITPIVNLEEKTINLMSKYSQKLVERRHQDMRDQATDVMENKKKFLEDEEKIRRVAEREGRRTRRRRDREKNGLNESHNEGMSSDDEVPDIELSQYRAQLSQVKSEAVLLFEDVDDEYSELRHVLKSFENWKNKDLNSYKEAYVHLCLPKICGTLIRPKMVLWNPFDENYEDIEKMEWFHLLAMYGKKSYETEDDLRNDPDLFLVPTVIEKVILPKLTKIIQELWDPLSTTQTLKLVGLLRRLQNEYPSVKQSSKKLHILFDAIVQRMTASTKSDVFIPILQKQPQDSKNPFFQRQFYSGLKLFRNILSFQGIVSDNALKDLAISSILNKYLMLALRIVHPTDGISKAHIIVYTLPRIWFSIPAIMDSLEMFRNFIKSAELQLDRKNPMNLDSFEKLKQIMSKLQPNLK